MKEIYYCIYNNAGYEKLVYTLIAETIYHQKGGFVNNKLKLKPAQGLHSFEKQILTKIVVGGVSRFHLSDYHKLLIEITNECITEKLLTYNLIHTKLKVTKKFRNEINQNLDNNNYCKEIIAYIDTGDLEILNKIDKNIMKVILPEFQKRIIKMNEKKSKYPFNKDDMDVINEAIANRQGSFRH